jgi:nitroimidazol reductase NimA-like FMN-containing flavoprotein (pyridoxamine 5'-phosphate oxidase superfamily)
MAEQNAGGMVHLEAQECWSLLGRAQVGRLAVANGDDVDIFPVNHLVDEKRVLFRTAPGTKLLEIASGRNVAFEVDDWSDEEAWSIVVKGRAEELDYPSALRHAKRSGLESWAPDEKSHYVQITPTRITGRRFARRREEPPRSTIWYW